MMPPFPTRRASELANRSAFGTSAEHARGGDSSSGSQANSSVEQFDRRTGSSSQGTEERSTISQTERVSGRHDRQAQISDQVSGTIGAGVGGRGQGGGGGRGLPGISGNVTKAGTQPDSMSWTTDDSRSSETGNTSSSGARNSVV